MDAEVVTTSMQSPMPTSTNSSWPSVLNHNSSGTDEDDVFQAVSASQQFYDHQSTDLQFTDFTQSSAAHMQHQPGRTPIRDGRNMSPFGQAFLVPNADSMSPVVMTTANSGAMTVDDNMAASFSQHISPSPIGSDSHAHFTGFGSNAVSTEHNAVFSGSFSVANSLQSVDTFMHSDGQNAIVIQPQSVAAGLGIQPSTKPDQKTDQKPSFPPPPKKPLSPYMRFSKGIWQKVKAENPNSSVCWVGSQIGQIWRELSDGEKQRYIDEFNKDKERYDIEFANYLKLTGLQASDLVKPRTKKKGTKRTTARTAKQPESQVTSSGVNQQPTVLVQTTAVPTTGQPNEITIMSVGNNGQPDRFLVSRSDGSQMGEMSSLPSISQVWSNSNFVANQELTNQMLIAAGQLAYNQPQLQQLQQQEQQRRLAEANAQRISLNGSNQQVATQYSEPGMAASHQQHTGIQQPASYANCTTQAMTTGMVSGQTPDTKCWSWQQVSVIPQNSQGVQQSNGTVTYQFPTNGAAWHSPVGHPQNHPTTAVVTNQPDRNNQLLLQTDVLDSQNLQMISTLQGQYNNITGAINNDIYRMNQTGNREPDQEILKLRAALHEATEQSVHLMKELTVVYAEVHELKQMNDELREQFRLWEEARMSGSGSSDMDARSGPSGQSA